MRIFDPPCPACGKTPWRPEHANIDHDADADSPEELAEWAETVRETAQ